MASTLEKPIEHGSVDLGLPAKAFEGSNMEALGAYQAPNMVKSVLYDDDLEQIQE